MIDNTKFVDATFLENLSDLKRKEYFKIDPEWVALKKQLDPEGYAELIKDWKAHEQDAKFWRDFEHDKWSDKLSSQGWSEIPTMVVPDLLRNQMERRFGPQWSSFGTLRHGIWQYYPKLRTTKKYYGKKRGINRHHVSDDFNDGGLTKEKK